MFCKMNFEKDKIFVEIFLIYYFNYFLFFIFIFYNNIINNLKIIEIINYKWIKKYELKYYYLKKKRMQ